MDASMLPRHAAVSRPGLSTARAPRPLLQPQQPHHRHHQSRRQQCSVARAADNDEDKLAPAVIDVEVETAASISAAEAGRLAAAAVALQAAAEAKAHGATTATASAPPPPKAAHAHGAAFDFACPICQTTTFKMASMPTKAGSLACPRCSRKFSSTDKYVDLTLTSGLQPQVYNKAEWGGQEMFRSPAISFVYERGWRQGFSWAGFPGADKEFEIAMDYLQPAYGETVIDMSCGSGLFSRRFAKSGRFGGVVAADFSESMLQQARAYFKEDGTLGGATPIAFLRADVGRLPFATGSVAAIHAGAALHCWPNPQAALAEISRVLRPGGVFVASTFLNATAPLGQLIGNDEILRPLNQLGQLIGNDEILRPLNQFDPSGAVVRAQYKWWEEQELKDLCASVGLDRYTRERSNRFIMLCARKPGSMAQQGQA
ncbi:hypothetical protein FOA52_015435 [Chlamydomonas sp. UWO 241]|nr:hypothetical protein FOA52_015435 [Chlamydomonas sp. UWO 241]